MESINQVSIIINGVRYDAVMNNSRNDCIDCAFFESCTENDTCCNFLGDMDGMHFEKSDKKFNGWQLITKDNAHEVAIIPPERLMIAVMHREKPVYMEYSEMFHNLDTMAELGGYYYYVLPVLKFE